MQGHKYKWLLVFSLKIYSAAFAFLKLILNFSLYFSYLSPSLQVQMVLKSQKVLEISHSTVALCFKPKYLK